MVLCQTLCGDKWTDAKDGARVWPNGGPSKLIMKMCRAALCFKLPTSALQLEHISLWMIFHHGASAGFLLDVLMCSISLLLTECIVFHKRFRFLNKYPFGLQHIELLLFCVQSVLCYQIMAQFILHGLFTLVGLLIYCHILYCSD